MLPGRPDAAATTQSKTYLTILENAKSQCLFKVNKCECRKKVSSSNTSINLYINILNSYGIVIIILNVNSWRPHLCHDEMKEKIVGFRYLGSDFIQSVTGISSSRVRYVKKSDPLVIHLCHSKMLFTDNISM